MSDIRFDIGRRASAFVGILRVMATARDLEALGFQPSTVGVTQLNIEHPDPLGLGPFCRLNVTTTAPLAPGVYARVVGDDVRYIGLASFLIHVVNGARMQRAYNDYTYVPASKVAQTGSPRVRVNGLLNRALAEGRRVSWWWLATESFEGCKEHRGSPDRPLGTCLEPSPAEPAVTAS